MEDEHISHVNDIIARQEISHEFRGRDSKQRPFTMWVKISPISSSEGDHLVCVISDITEQKKAEQQLITTSSELDTILENAMVGIAFIKDRVLLRVNQKFEDIFGFDKGEVIGQNTRCLFPSVESFEELGVKAYGDLEQGLVFEGEMQLAKRNGDRFWCAISSKAITTSRPQDGTIWLFEDVTKQRENDEKLRKLASLDALTGLPNRAVFHDRLSQAIRKAHLNSGRLAIFFLDLDHFKHINDSLGHNAGDGLLCKVADRLRTCIRDDDTVARLGGDEFTIILEDIRSVSFVAKVAEKVLNSVMDSYTIAGTEVNISPSIGVSLYPADGRDTDVLIRNADAAMYHAKHNGRNNFQFYSAEMNAQAAHRLSLETDLRKAVEQSDFYLNFQPQFSLDSKKIIGAEVLLRWNSLRWGDVSPAEFVPILEETGLIGVVGEMVLKEACQAYMRLSDKLDPNFKMAVNLSGRQFHGSPLAAFVKKTLNDTGMSAANLELEITESILMKDTNLAVTTLSQLTELGVTLAIDDFGTGYSSLSYLKKLPLDALKIDKSFIQDVTIDKDDAAIVDAILAMSKHLEMDVVAEGIETEEQLEFLKRHHCRRGQGYYFSHPLNFDGFSALVNQQLRA
jgi:diguanylate cyclase (GGDEF)-like protein/PAS domain S-box-containing protein